MNTLELRKQKALLVMTERQTELRDGMLLGDAHLERQRGARTARLKIEHSVRQSAYVDWKYEEWRVGSGLRQECGLGAIGSVVR